MVEGYYAAKSAYELGKAKGIDMPITDAAYKVLYEGADVKDAVQELLSRQRKSESEDAAGNNCIRKMASRRDAILTVKKDLCPR